MTVITNQAPTNLVSSAVVSGAIELNSTSAIAISAAKPATEPRMFFEIFNAHASVPVWVRLMPAADSTTSKRGLRIDGGKSWRMSEVSIYNGEISAIGDSDSPNVYVTEY